MALLSSDDQLPRLYPEKDAAFSAGQTGSEGGIVEKTRPGVTRCSATGNIHCFLRGLRKILSEKCRTGGMKC